MQSLATLFVTFVVVGLVGAGEARIRRAADAPVDQAPGRHATIARAVDAPAAAAPLPPHLSSPGALAPSLHAPRAFAALLPRAPLPAPRASLPLYLRHRALLL